MACTDICLDVAVDISPIDSDRGAMPIHFESQRKNWWMVVCWTCWLSPILTWFGLSPSTFAVFAVVCIIVRAIHVAWWVFRMHSEERPWRFLCGQGVASLVAIVIYLSGTQQDDHPYIFATGLLFPLFMMVEDFTGMVTSAILVIASLRSHGRKVVTSQVETFTTNMMLNFRHSWPNPVQWGWYDHPNPAFGLCVYLRSHPDVPWKIVYRPSIVHQLHTEVFSMMPLPRQISLLIMEFLSHMRYDTTNDVSDREFIKFPSAVRLQPLFCYFGMLHVCCSCPSTATISASEYARVLAKEYGNGSLKVHESRVALIATSDAFRMRDNQSRILRVGSNGSLFYAMIVDGQLCVGMDASQWPISKKRMHEEAWIECKSTNEDEHLFVLTRRCPLTENQEMEIVELVVKDTNSSDV